MKALVKGISLLLAIITSMAVVGCTPQTGPTTSDAKEPELIEFGTHIYTSPEVEGDRWLVKDGKTEYKLVVPATTIEADTKFFREAKNEFIKWFEASTNITLDVVIDTGLQVKTHQPDQHYISLDDTTLFNSLKGTENEIDCAVTTVTTRGGKIVTVDNNIYINGFADMGTLNMVYTFLQINFNWETYSSTTTLYDENVTDFKLRNYDVFDIPDTHYTPTSGYEKENMVNVFWTDWGFQMPHATEQARKYGQRVRAYSQTDAAIKMIKSDIFVTKPIEEITDEEWNVMSNPSGHNSTQVLNEDYWKGTHPEWFGGGQLCYTCGGNEESFELATTLIANMLCRGYLMFPRDQYPYKNIASITITDASSMCTCETCSREKVIYKDSGLVVKYMNRVAEKVDAWMNIPGNEDYKRDEFKIEYYAYLSCDAPPTKLNAQGEWEAIDDTVKMHKNTVVYYANINTDFQQSLFAEDNKWALDQFDGWAAIANGNISYFMYNYYTGKNHNYFYDGFDYYCTQVMNHHLAGGNVYYYSENLHGNAATEFGALVSYINAKLCYDSTLDSGELIQNWFDAQFGDASGIMMEMFRMIRTFNHFEAVRTQNYRRFSIYNQIYHQYFWKSTAVESWIGKTDEAIERIAYLKETDPEEYDRICYNIEIEAFSPIWIMFNQNESNSSDIRMTDAQKSKYKSRILRNIERFPEYKYCDAAGKPAIEWVNTL